MGKFKERRKEIKKLPLRERPAFQKFKDIFPTVAGAVAGIFPGGGAVKAIIEGLMSEPRSQVEKEVIKEFLEPIEHEEQISDLEDVQNAREAELMRMESPDFLVRNIVPIIAITWTIFSMVIFTLVFVRKIEVTENMQFLIISTVGNILMLIIGYYFGSTSRSGAKDKTIQMMQNKTTT